VSTITVLSYVFYKNINRVEHIDANINDTTVKLELADTEAQRDKGLSERDELPDGWGMLFDFKQDGDWRMWTVQMRFPIDIVWLDSNKKVVHVKNNARPADYPERYHAPEPSRYVIELNAGHAAELGIKNGDFIVFNYP